MTKIMVVDDEPDISESVKSLLESEGYDVTVAGDGKECLSKLGKEKPDLILMDFFMPGMSGREVVEAIRKKDKDTKIAFMTVAEFRDAGMKKLYDLGISDYIPKPIDTKDLIGRIKKILQK